MNTTPFAIALMALCLTAAPVAAEETQPQSIVVAAAGCEPVEVATYSPYVWFNDGCVRETVRIALDQL